MKKMFASLLSLLAFVYIHGQNATETEIRKLDSDQKEAYFTKDTITLAKLFYSGFVVNSPLNIVETLPDLLVRMRKGTSDRESYERNIEKITFIDNVAVVMGSETLKPTGLAKNAGKTVKNRYTNIWMKRGNNWQLIARQATIISVE